MNKLIFCSTLGILLTLAACNKDPLTPGSGSESLSELKIPDGFNFITTVDVNLSVLVKNSSQSLSGIPVKLFLDNPGSGEEPDPSARLVGTYASDEGGRIDVQFRLPSYMDTVFLKTDFIGLESLAAVSVAGGNALYVYGEGVSDFKEGITVNPQSGFFKSTILYSYLGTYTKKGVPDYLVSPRDIITQDFLNDVNASLPENIRLPVSHPDYLSVGNEADIILKEEADIWVTFVHEGAGYLNSMGYYLYDQANPPKSASDITKYNVILPNASYSGSGGGMTSGDKVYLGRFPAGKGIGWFLVPNGWNGSKVSGSKVYYSEPGFNPESNSDKKQHTVLLYDSKTSRLLVGFEDLDRMAGSDEDFNDLIYYITANPVRAVDISRVPPVDTPSDRDNDGISDTFDDYPDDKNLAFDYFYPAKGIFGSLIVEDLWPSYGDFDFNDLVIEYNFNQVADPKNQIKQLNIQLKTKAIGASFRNGFGIQLPVSSSVIESVTGNNVKGDYISLNAKGYENGQTKAVIIAFEDAYDVLAYNGSGTGVNVIPGNGWTDPQTMTIKVILSTPQTITAMGQAPYNPFLIVDGRRGQEIHLSGKVPTDLADGSYFGQSQDATDSKTGKYYSSVSNLTWIIDIPASFEYMIEKNDITRGYSKMATWAETGGISYPDWYLDKPGYRESSLIYKK